MMKRLVSRLGDGLDVAKGEEIKHHPQMWAGVIEREVVPSTELGKYWEERYICFGHNPSKITKNYRLSWIAYSYLNNDFFHGINSISSQQL